MTHAVQLFVGDCCVCLISNSMMTGKYLKLWDILLFINISIFINCDGYFYDDNKEESIMTRFYLNRLHEEFLENDNYKVSLRSEFNIPVSIYFTLFSVNEFDEIKGTLQSVGIIFLSWNDTRLKWNTSDYGDIDFFSAHLQQVWKPEIALLNSINRFELLAKEQDRTTVWVTAIGEVHYAFGGIFSTSCDPDVKYFPFDVHECHLLFVPFEDIFFTEYLNDTVLIRHATINSSDVIDEDGKWEYRTLKPCVRKVGATSLKGAYFPILLQRRWSFTFTNIIVPVLIIGYLNVFVFLIPVEAGERISFAVTVLLSYTVFMIVLATSIPETANPMPLISFFLVFKLGYSACIVCAIIIVTHLFHRDGNRPCSKTASRIVSIVDGMQSKMCCESKGKVSLPRSNDHNEDSAKGDEPFSDFQASFNKHEIPEQEENTTTVKKYDLHKDFCDDMTWGRFSKALDKIFFLIFSFVVIVETMAFFLILLHNFSFEGRGNDSESGICTL